MSVVMSAGEVKGFEQELLRAQVRGMSSLNIAVFLQEIEREVSGMNLDCLSVRMQKSQNAQDAFKIGTMIFRGVPFFFLQEPVIPFEERDSFWAMMINHLAIQEQKFEGKPMALSPLGDFVQWIRDYYDRW